MNNFFVSNFHINPNFQNVRLKGTPSFQQNLIFKIIETRTQDFLKEY